MKATHKNTYTGDAPGDELSRAKKFEEEGELDKAAATFEKLIKDEPLNEYAYNRLMIIYRKNKDYQKELAIIKRGISAFEQSFKSSSKITVTRKISALSKSLLKTLGLTDKRGTSLYEREPVGKWKRRKLVVERMIKRIKKGR